MTSPKAHVRVTLTTEQRTTRLRSLLVALGAAALLLVALVVVALGGDGGWLRWALLGAALVPLAVAVVAVRGIVVLSRTSRTS